MIQLKNLSFKYRKNWVLKNLDLSIEEGECVALLGASGSGKSTLLNILSGLLKPNSGSINNQHKSGIQSALVFQDYALFPNLSVAQNLHFVSKNQKEIESWVNRLELSDVLKQKPHQLSGGQKQRVAVARALLCKPDLLLMDEPFSNLDTAHKNKLRSFLKDLLQDVSQSTLLVTHDLEDAFAIADRIAIIGDGAILQVGTPQEVYYAPTSLEVLRLTGAFCQLPIKKEGHNLYCRPEKLRPDCTKNTMDVKLLRSVFSGSYWKNYYEAEAIEGWFPSDNQLLSEKITLGIEDADLIVI